MLEVIRITEDKPAKESLKRQRTGIILRFFGEAADSKNERAKTSAWNNAKRLFDTERVKLQADLDAVTATYETDEKGRDTISKHGRQQTRHDKNGQDVRAVEPGFRLRK